MVTVIKTINDCSYQTCLFPGDMSGTLYIQVQDTDRTRGRRVLESVFIDHMYVLTSGSSETLRTCPAAITKHLPSKAYCRLAS